MGKVLEGEELALAFREQQELADRAMEKIRLLCKEEGIGLSAGFDDNQLIITRGSLCFLYPHITPR